MKKMVNFIIMTMNFSEHLNGIYDVNISLKLMNIFMQQDKFVITVVLSLLTTLEITIKHGFPAYVIPVNYTIK